MPVASTGATAATSTSATQPSPTFALGRVSSRRTGVTGWKAPTCPTGLPPLAGGVHPGVWAEAGETTIGTERATVTPSTTARPNLVRIPSIARQDRHEEQSR